MSYQRLDYFDSLTFDSHSETFVPKTLTEAQTRYLREIVSAGERAYNGRARRTLEALRAAGFITFESDLHLHTRGDTSWTLTARPTHLGRSMLPNYDKSWLSV